MKNIKRIWKGLIILTIISIIWLIAIVYISSLSSYKTSDFNIPEDYFYTRYMDKKIDSKGNGYNDYIDFLKEIEEKSSEIGLRYFYFKSKCIIEKKCNKITDDFLKEEMRKKWIKNRKDLVKSKLREFSKFARTNKERFKKIKEKEYIKTIVVDDVYISQSSYFTYIRALPYLIYTYLEKWQYEKWMYLLLEHQKSLDNLINKVENENSPFPLAIYEYNLRTIEYFLNNYRVQDDIKYSIKKVLETKIRDWLTIDQNKVYRNRGKKIFEKYINDLSLYYKISHLFFFSERETLLLLDKNFYDMIEASWKRSIFFDTLMSWNEASLFDGSIRNYIGRKIISWTWRSFKNFLKKEKRAQELRARILKSLQ